MHLVWKIYNRGTYGERAELIAVYGKLSAAKKAKEQRELESLFDYLAFGITTWAVK